MHNDDPQSRAAVITMVPIGVIHTPFQQCEGTPIQSATANGAKGVVELFPEFTIGLIDVADFERLWLIYLLDRATSPQLTTRPYLDTEDHGIFATRSPARPNHIGLSAVRLKRGRESGARFGCGYVERHAAPRHQALRSGL